MNTQFKHNRYRKAMNSAMVNHVERNAAHVFGCQAQTEKNTFLHAIPQALQRVLLPSGPLRICDVSIELNPH
jgi:flagellar biosynthesis/type III secretory pathway protein FliH